MVSNPTDLTEIDLYRDPDSGRLVGRDPVSGDTFPVPFGGIDAPSGEIGTLGSQRIDCGRLSQHPSNVPSGRVAVYVLDSDGNVYQKASGSSPVQVGGSAGSDEWTVDGDGNLVPVDDEPIGDGTTTANHQSISAVNAMNAAGVWASVSENAGNSGGATTSAIVAYTIQRSIPLVSLSGASRHANTATRDAIEAIRPSVIEAFPRSQRTRPASMNGTMLSWTSPSEVPAPHAKTMISAISASQSNPSPELVRVAIRYPSWSGLVSPTPAFVVESAMSISVISPAIPTTR